LVETISQHVDTLKFHYYISKKITDDSFKSYIQKIEQLISLKKESQEAANNYQDTKTINKYFGTHKFNVMDKGIKGFSVVIANNDISIALRKTKSKINPSPIMKVEFRAEFLARKGYKQAIKIVNDFVSTHLLDSYRIKISEIHLATDVQGYNFRPLDFYRVKTRARKRTSYEEETDFAKASLYGGLTTFTGMTFGSGDYHLRIYNKTVEIMKQKNKGFAKTLLWSKKSNYDAEKTVWRIEIQIRRAKLKRLVNSDKNTMDDYSNILNAIPDLWSKALTDYTFKDINRDLTAQMMDGVRVLKNGTEKPFTKNAIYQIFKRANNLYFWDGLKTWNGHEPQLIETAFKTPTPGAFEYVSNSIKSLYSTVGKHYGSVSADVLIKAFKEADEQNIDKKQVSLLSDSFEKSIDWFERIEYMKQVGVVDVPDYKDLEANIYQTVFKADEYIKDSPYSTHLQERLEARTVFPPAVHFYEREIG